MIKLLIVCSLLSLIDAGVKIEVRLKESPTNDETRKSLPIDLTTTTEITTTTSTTPATTASQVNAIPTNAITVPNIEVTTIPSQNVTQANQTMPAQTNQTLPAPTNLTQTNFTNIIINNVTLAQTPITLNTPFLSELTRRQLRRKLIPSNYYCPCDLKINFCDINCCCDVDCASQEIMQTLKCTEHDWSIHDYEDMSDLQLCSHSRRFSLFCVVDNSRRRKQYRKRDFKLHDVNILSAAEYRWPEQFDQNAFSVNDYREHYAYGDSILIWDETNEEIQTLSIPWSFESSNCHIKSSIKHLMNDQIKCVQTFDEHDQFLTEFQTKLKSSKILTQRKPLNTPTVLMMDYCKSPSNENETMSCIEIKTFHCNEIISQRSCKPDTNQTIINEFGDGLIADEISIQFHHNFTDILNCTVFFVYHDLNGGGGGGETIGQMMRIINLEYLELNESFVTKDAHQVSGNIGYLQHKPIIITKYTPDNVTVNGDQMAGILAYFHNDTNCTNDEHYLKLPAIQANGDCILTNYTFQTINFGENTLIKCKALLIPNMFNDSQDHIETPNNTYLCRAFQLTIFDYLLHRFELEPLNATAFNKFNVFVSELGNPRNDSSHWINFRTVQAPNIDDVVAIDTGTGEFTCSNMILGVRYEFFYGRMLFGSVPNQALIRMAQIHFGSRLNLKFKIDDDALRVPLNIDVMFYDFSRMIRNNAAVVVPSFVWLLFLVVLSSFINK